MACYTRLALAVLTPPLITTPTAPYEICGPFAAMQGEEYLQSYRLEAGDGCYHSQESRPA
jgi:hypothetical protein